MWRSINMVLLILITVSYLINLTNAVFGWQTTSLAGIVEYSSLSAMQQLSLAYKLIQPDLTVDTTTGLSQAIFSAIGAQQIDFGIVTAAPSEAAMAIAPSMKLTPILLTGLVPIYRLDSLGPNSPSLIITRAVLAKIWIGNITVWNHPDLVQCNPSLKLPAQNITIVYEYGASGRNTQFKTALQSFYPQILNESSIKIDSNADWPINLYASSVGMAPSTSGLVTATAANDGAFTVAYNAVAVELQAARAQMINQYGNIVSISESSLTYAAVDLATKPQSSVIAVLSDSASPNAWPLSLMSYLALDTSFSRSTCKAKAQLVEFFLYFYQSNVASAILLSLGYVPVPQIILQQYNVIKFLSSTVQCRSAPALPVQVTNQRKIGSANAILLLAKLFSSLYQDPDPSSSWVAQFAPDNILVRQMWNSELDIALINPENVEPALWASMQASDEFLMMPIYAQAVSQLINPQISSTVMLPYRPRLTLDLILQMGSNCLSDWNDPRLAALNPWLTSVTSNRSIPIRSILGCGASMDDAPVTSFVLRTLSVQAKKYPTSDTARCLFQLVTASSLSLAYATCNQSIAPPGLQFVLNEPSAPAMIMGQPGGLGAIYVDGDPNKYYPELVWTQSGVTTNRASDLDGMLACAYDTFSPSTLSFNFAQSSNLSCWPLSQQTYMIVRQQYFSVTTNSSSCVRGLSSLKFARWMVETAEIDALTDASNIARLTEVKGVIDTYRNALNAVLCDDDTLLITMPVIWVLDSTVEAMGYVIAALGSLYTTALMVLTVAYRKQPQIRAASPSFMIISLIGVQLLFGAVVALIMPVSNTSCTTLSVLVNLGVTLTYAPLCAKTWRLNKIFNRRKLSVIKISNRRLMMLVVLQIAVELGLLIPWQVISPFQPITKEVVQGSGRTYHYSQCWVSDSGLIFFYIAAVMKGALLLWAAILAFGVRKLTGHYNESSHIAISIYNIIFTMGIIVPILIVIDAVGDIQVGLLLFVALWISFFSSTVISVPKFLQIFSQSGQEAAGVSVVASHGNSSSGFSFVSLEQLETLAVLNQYFVALKHHSDLVENKITALKRGKNNGNTSVHTAAAGSRGPATSAWANSHTNSTS